MRIPAVAPLTAIRPPQTIAVRSVTVIGRAAVAAYEIFGERLGRSRAAF
jgi:hypothetical protein